MANDQLIEALDRARDSYSQRQRAANNLAAALKGTTGALGKAARALREYAEGGSSEGAARAQEAFGALRLREEAIDPLNAELRRALKPIAAATTALKDALAALRGESVDVVKLGRAHAQIRPLAANDAELGALLPAIEQELEQAQRSLADTFGLALRHALAEQGVELRGRPPRFEIGPFELAADFVARGATLSYGKTLVNKRVPLSVEAVVKAYQREERLIRGRNEDGARWIEQLYNAWLAVRRKRDSAELRAGIVECYYELVMLRQSRSFRSAPTKGGFADYSRAQFAYDFFAFTNRQPAFYKELRAFGTVATKSQVENVERSIWIVEGDSPHDGRYIADVKFDKDE